MEEYIKSIAPYSEEEVRSSLRELEFNEEFIKGVQFFYKNWTKEDVVSRLQSCNSCADFQVQFLERIIKNSIENTMTSFKICGLDSFDTSNCFYISNHRDIFLDSALLQNHLYDIGKPFTEISLGDNLMVNDTLKTIAKLNNMFTVIRSNNKSEMLTNSLNLSNYLRYSITQKKVSSWIAQRNGRTKDGNDITAPGLIKMLLLSGGNDIKKSIAEFNLVVSTISFEYEPCAFEKSNELSITEQEGKYKKEEYENINSIIAGVNDFKGNVKLVFEKLDIDKIQFSNIRKKDAVTVANAIDGIVYKNYQLWKTNYMAYDLLYNDNKYEQYYNKIDIVNFKYYLAKADNKDKYFRLLKMYVNPLLNKESL